MSLLVAERNLGELRRSPSIDRALDNTAMSAYMTCPTLFNYAYILHRRGRGAPSPAIAYGSAWHTAMEVHYKTGGDAAAVERAVIMAWQPHEKPDDHRTVYRVLAEYKNYVTKYGTPEHEARNFGATVGYPENPLVEISTEVAWPEALHPYTGKIDRIIEWQGLYFVEDHKSTSQMGASYFNQFDPSNQMMGYAWIAQLLTGLPIAGVRINAHAVLKTQSKFERQTVSYSQQRLENWGANFNLWVEKIEADIKANTFAHNFNACAGKYGMCPYTGVCTMNPDRRLASLEADFDEVEWNPMAGAEEIVAE